MWRAAGCLHPSQLLWSQNVRTIIIKRGIMADVGSGHRGKGSAPANKLGSQVGLLIGEHAGRLPADAAAAVHPHTQGSAALPAGQS
jgi:hypothetical protein